MSTAIRARLGGALLLSLVALLMTVVIVTPIALSSQDLIRWAAAPTGLGLHHPWPWLVFVSLDAAAGVCVLLSVYCAWRGEAAGVFGVLVWCFAAASAFANWRHSTAPGAAPDAVWFYPTMSLAGPALLETVLARLRRWIQRRTGRRGRATPAFGWRRWVPGVGATRDTYGAWRTALLLGISEVDEAIVAYHRLCPTGSLRVAATLRAQHANQREADTGEGESERADRLAVDVGGLSVVADDPPVALMRRIPVDRAAYLRWRQAWADIQAAGPEPDLPGIACRHQVSLRQIQFVCRAGQHGLLESVEPTALHLASLARGGDRRP